MRIPSGTAGPGEKVASGMAEDLVTGRSGENVVEMIKTKGRVLRNGPE